MHFLHHPQCVEYAALGHPERPSRVQHSAAHLSRAFPGATWIEPGAADLGAVLRAHSEVHLERLLEPTDFDADTPYHEGISEHAFRAAGAAVACAEQGLAGRKPFSLMRPPGHHACREKAMGFCYLSSVAIAALAARAAGAKRVAVWDFDAHHGNGTEDILKGVPGCLFSSVHQFPGYPGTGKHSDERIHNYPVAPGCDPVQHMEVLESSWETVLEFKPDLILVSAGFDAYRHDPLTELGLEFCDFAELGRWCAAAGRPVGAVLEGGYSEDLPLLIEAFLKNWWG